MEFLRIPSEGKHRRGSFEPNAFAVVFHSFSVKLKAQSSNLSAQEWIVNQDCFKFKFDVSRRICSIQIHGALSQHKRTWKLVPSKSPTKPVRWCHFPAWGVCKAISYVSDNLQVFFFLSALGLCSPNLAWTHLIVHVINRASWRLYNLMQRYFHHNKSLEIEGFVLISRKSVFKFLTNISRHILQSRWQGLWRMKLALRVLGIRRKLPKKVLTSPIWSTTPLDSRT
jgi:hypothetical protein